MTCGMTVSTAKVRRLLSSAPSLLGLPAASAKRALSMAMDAGVLLLAWGRNTALRVRPVPPMAPSVPPLTVMSPVMPSHWKVLPGFSLKVKVMVALSPLFKLFWLAVMATVGATRSRLKVLLVQSDVLPAASVTAACNCTAPSAKVVSALAGSTTAWACPLVGRSSSATCSSPWTSLNWARPPACAVTLYRPPVAVASLVVTPSATLVKACSCGASGARLSTLKSLLAATLDAPSRAALPASSLNWLPVGRLKPLKAMATPSASLRVSVMVAWNTSAVVPAPLR